jgi:Mo25-like
MTKYISNPDNLKLMMNMLREKSRNIQFEAFHVFKVFVAVSHELKLGIQPSTKLPILVES